MGKRFLLDATEQALYPWWRCFLNVSRNSRSRPDENNWSKIYHFVIYRPWAEHPLQVLREVPGLKSPSSPTSGADAEL